MKKLFWHRSRFNPLNLFNPSNLHGPYHSSQTMVAGRIAGRKWTGGSWTGGSWTGGRLMLIGSLLSLSGLTAGLLARPAVVYAYTTEDLLTVSREVGEDYTALSRRAEMAARARAQQRFDSDILLTRVIITVLGQNGGQMAPILELNVSRNDWRSRPDPQRWSKYYRSTRTLLGLDSTPTTVTQPAGTIPAPPSFPTSPSPFPAPAPFPAPLIEPDPANAPAPLDPFEPTSPLPADTDSSPSFDVPATPPGQVGLPRSILR